MEIRSLTPIMANSAPRKESAGEEFSKARVPGWEMLC